MARMSSVSVAADQWCHIMECKVLECLPRNVFPELMEHFRDSVCY